MSAVKRSSLRRALLQGAALASLTALLLPPPVALARPRAAPVPSATLSVPAQALLGENLSFTVTFGNTDPADTGYGPYVDLYLPWSGIDGSSPAPGNDGISIVSATYGGLSAVLQTVNCNAGANFTPASDGIARVCPAAPGNYTGSAAYVWQLSILQLPFGSFVPTQPPATVSVTAALSGCADLAQNLPIRAQPGFRYGSTPTGTVPPVPLVGGSSVANTSPTLLSMSKAFSGPENETASGPNFQRTYTLTVNVATGQTITNLDVSDDLPGSVQFVSVATAPASAAIDTPSTVTPGGLLTRRFASITGGAGANDATVTVTFYVPDNDALGLAVVSHISTTAGAGVPITNTGNAQGSWTPLDVRDGPQTPSASATQTFTARSLAIQKTASIVSDTGPAGTSPGDIVEYALQFQVSDYFAYGNLVIPSDILSDGQLLAAMSPTLTITQNGGTSGPTDFTSGNWSSTSDTPLAGQTLLTFNISAQLVGSGQLLGGLVVDGAPADDGPTTGVIRFRAVIQDAYAGTVPSGNPSLNEGDAVGNNVTLSGDSLNAGTCGSGTCDPAAVFSEQDGSSAGLTVGVSGVTKTIYAVNGVVCAPQPCSGVQVAPGDTVTYRIRDNLLLGDYENLLTTDYLPKPIFLATEVVGPFIGTVSAAAPASGSAKFGPADTMYVRSGRVPSISTDATANTVAFSFGTRDDPANASGVIDILLTVTVQPDPFADGLFLTNQVQTRDNNSESVSSTGESLVQLQITEPVLNIRKGVINTDAGNPAYSPVGPMPAGVSVSPPGGGCPRLSGTGMPVGSTLLGTTFNSNLSGVDADDSVTFSILVENTGRGLNGAFDVRIRDTLPAGFSPTMVGPENINLCVTDGTGAPIAYTGGGLFAGGIELVDPGPTNPPTGALDPGRDASGALITTGRNIAILTYDLILDGTVPPGQVLTNTASLDYYAGREGGPNHVPGGLTDPATVTTALPVVAKAITGTNQAHTLGNNVAIGEQVTYQLVITIPEGVANNVSVVDTLDPGLAFVRLDSLTASTDLSTSIAGGFPRVLSNARGALSSSVATYSFGTLTNSNRVNAAPETITITYTAVVLNSAGNNRGVGLNNNAVISWTGGSASGAAPNVTIVEPTLQVAKVAMPATGDAGDLITFNMTFSHTPASDADAFDVTLSDVVPAGMTFVGGSLVCTSGVQDPDSYSFDGVLITASWASFLDNGTTGICTFQVALNDDVEPGQVITNTANLAWTSLPGDVRTPQSTFNALSTERTGSTLDPGGTENDYRASGPATVTVFQVPDKSLKVTSESHSGDSGSGERVAIGEIVRYHLAFQLAEGIATNLRLQDELPAGMRFLNDGTAKVAFVSNGPGITSDTIIPGPPPCDGLVIPGNSAAVTPTCPLPDTAVSSSDTSNDDTYGSGTDVYFKLGTLDNRDRDVDGEFTVVEFNALVENVGGNTAGHALGNDFIPRVGTTAFPASNPLVVTVAVPNITLTKVVTTVPSDAGDTLIYTLTATNASDANVAAAFDLSLADTIDPRLAIQDVSGSTTGGACGATPSTFDGSFLVQQVTATATCLNPGGVMTVVITARVANNVQAGSTIPNTADLAYTTLPGLTGTSPNPTGSTTPGASGDPTGERILTTQASVSRTLSAPTIIKLLPSPAQQTIGGQADYDLLVTLPEGATTNLRVRDALPAGLAYVSHNVITSGASLPAAYNGTLTTTPACPACAVGASGVTLEFQFGDAQTNGSGPANGSARNQFIVRVRARVLNVAGNQNGTPLANTASLVYANPQTGDTTVSGGSQSLTVTEPELEASKTPDDATPGFGQVVTYRITVSHGGGSTVDAFDLNLSDVIPPGLTYVVGSLANGPGVPAVLDGSGVPTLRASWATLALGQSSVIRYQATVGSPPSVNIGDVPTNDVDLTWTSLSGPSGDERTGVGGVNDYWTTTTAPVTVTGPDLRVSKSDRQVSASPRDMLTYAVTVYNAGNTMAANVLLADTLPANTAFISASDGGSESSPGVVTWPMFNLASATSVFRTVTVQVDNPLPSGVESLTNTAEAHDDGTAGPDPTPSDNTATDVDTVDAAPDLVISKTDGLSIVSPGQTLTYVLTYSNAGDQDATGVTISETVPAGTTFTGPVGWSCIPPPPSPAGAPCTYTIGNLAAGAGGTVNFVVVINDPAGVPAVVNTSTIADDGANGPDQNPANNTATDTDNLVTLPDADLTKSLADTNQAHTLDPDAAIGEILTYRVVMTIPAGSMPSAVLTDVLDRGLAFVGCQSLTPSVGLTTVPAGAFAAACSGPIVAEEPAGSSAAEDQGRRVGFDLGSMTSAGPSDATLTLIYTAVVIDNAENVRGVNPNNEVTWTWVGGQLVDSAPSVTIVEPTLTLTKTAAPMSAPPGTPITFTITLGQNAASDSAAFDLVLQDVVPLGLAYIPGTLTVIGGPPAASDESGAPTLIVRWDSFGLGETATVQFQATMGNLGPGDGVTNSARLEWTSLPEDPPLSLNLSSYNPLAAERRYDPATGVDLYGVTADVTVRVPRLPETGFASGRVTDLDGTSRLTDLGALTLEIPALGVSIPIVGVPADEEGWDLTWLAAQAGYLEGTAYPTHRGNSALTAHVTLPNGRPGPFARLADLSWGDRVVVHAYGLRYIYEVRTVVRVTAGDLRPIGHKDQAWLTLITCGTYDEAGGRYLHRIVVQAVLIEVAEE